MKKLANVLALLTIGMWRAVEPTFDLCRAATSGIDSLVAAWCPDEVLRYQLYATMLSLTGQLLFVVAAVWLSLALLQSTR